MPIRVLPPMVASRIAAGEVIERPASVVKELVENALDAAARHVVVEADGGGVERLCVADDGVGIAAGEVRLAFARHATSKLTALDDLDQLATFGFRGEALPSIAAVAEVGLLTRCADQPDGSLVRVRFGRLVEEQRAARAPGTTVTVADLFGELPARRKFLRAPGSEASQVARVATQLALGQPGVRFEIRVDGRVVLATPGRGDAREVLAAVYGPSIARAMLPLPEPAANGAGLQVRGLVGPPDVHRGTRAGITLFVNGRLVYSRALQYAVEEAFHTLLPVGRRPIALLWLDVPPTDLDVNVHPTKQEVRFLHDRMVFAAVQRAVREVVGDAAGVPVWGGEAQSPVTADAATNGGRAADQAGPDEMGAAAAAPRSLFPALDDAPPRPERAPRLAVLRVLGQVGLTYITAEGDAGLYLVDQHAAHERVLLEELRRNAARHDRVQYLLESQAVELRPGQAAALRAAGAGDGLAASLNALGFVVEEFGPRTVLLRAIPAALKPATVARVLQETLDALGDDEPDAPAHDGADWRERLCLLFACKTAVKAGQLLSFAEMRALLEQLDEAELGRTCAHGRPTAVLLTHGQLEREFGRR